MYNQRKHDDSKMKQNSHDVVKLLLLLFSIFLYLFIICYNEAFFSIFSFPDERTALPINFYLLNMLDLLFWNFSFFLFMPFAIVFIIILFEFITQIITAMIGKSNWPRLNWQSIVLFYRSNKLLVLSISSIITYTIMLLAYEYKNYILNSIIEENYVLAENDEFGLYILISLYIFLCFAFSLRRDRYIDAAKNLLTIRRRPFGSSKPSQNGQKSEFFIYLFLLLFFIMFIFFNDSLVVKMGTEDAIRLVQGKPLLYEGDPGRYELKLLMNDSRINLSNKSLIFFMHQDGIYYFIEKQGPDFNESNHNYTQVYAVPINSVKLASLTLCKSEKERKSLTSSLI